MIRSLSNDFHLIVFTVVIMILIPRSASATAGDAGSMAILPVQTGGALYIDSDPLTKLLVKAARDMGIETVVVAAADTSLHLERCNDLSCLMSIGKRLGVDRVLLTRVTPLGRATAIELRLANVDEGRIERFEKDRCQNPESIEPTLQYLIKRVVNGFVQEKGLLRVTTNPAHSTVFVNGKAVGFSPVDISLSEGQYDIRARRSGHLEASRLISVSGGDTIRVNLILTEPHVGLDQRKTTVSTRLLAWGGFPLHKQSPFIGSQVGVGGMMQYGERTRFGFGAFTHSTKLNISEDVWKDYSAAEAPSGWVMVVTATFNFAPRGMKMGPVLGLGVAGVQRTVKVQLSTGGTEKWENDMELGGLLSLGFDIPINEKWFIELAAVNVFANGKNPTQDNYSPPPHQIWKDGFDALKSFSTLHVSVGVDF